MLEMRPNTGNASRVEDTEAGSPRSTTTWAHAEGDTKASPKDAAIVSPRDWCGAKPPYPWNLPCP